MVGLALLCVLGFPAVAMAKNPRILLETSPERTFQLTRGPLAAAVADFNVDGKADVATMSGFGASVSLLIGDGAGRFSQLPALPSGFSPVAMSVADFNGDGRPDIAAANKAAGTVGVFIGNGSGGFTPMAPVAIGAKPISIIAGDFNSDGKPDLATGNGIGSTVSVLLGDGQGSFALRETLTLGPYTEALAVGDFDGNGKLDLAVANSSSNTVSILLGDGTGGFTKAPTVLTEEDPQSIAAADLNSDGKVDLAIASTGGFHVGIAYGRGNGLFRKQRKLATSEPQSIVVGDFDGNGRPDLAFANSNRNTVSLLLGKRGDDLITSIPLEMKVAEFPETLVAGDFNGDKKSELAVINTLADTVTVLINKGTLPPLKVSKFKISKQNFTSKQWRSVKFSYRLSESAEVRILIEKRGRGAKLGHYCLPKESLGTRDQQINCRGWVAIGVVSSPSQRAGNRRQRLSSMYLVGSSGSRLRPGKYRASIELQDAVGNVSDQTHIRFTYAGASRAVKRSHRNASAISETATPATTVTTSQAPEFGPQPLEFKDRQLARSWFKEEFLGRKPLHSAAEIEAVDRYQVTPEVNGYLRVLAQQAGSSQLDRESTSQSALAKVVAGMDGAITHGQLSQSIVVYRGVTEIAIPRAVREGKQATYVDPGYLSTSVMKFVAGRFTGPGSVLVKVTLPAGSCVVAPDFRGMSNYGEFELILPRKTSYTLKSVRRLSRQEFKGYLTEGFTKKEIQLGKGVLNDKLKQQKNVKLYELMANPSCAQPAAP